MKTNEKILEFTFTLFLVSSKVVPGLRMSAWQVDDSSYLMPSEITKVTLSNNHYYIKVICIDPNDKIKISDIKKKFFFGHPGKIFGEGVLETVMPARSS